MDANDVRKRLRDLIDEIGCTQQEFAKVHEISPQYLSDILNGKREPSEKVANLIGLTRVVTYEWIKP